MFAPAYLCTALHIIAVFNDKRTALNHDCRHIQDKVWVFRRINTGSFSPPNSGESVNDIWKMRHCSCEGEALLSGQRVSSLLPCDWPSKHLCESPAGGHLQTTTMSINHLNSNKWSLSLLFYSFSDWLKSLKICWVTMTPLSCITTKSVPLKKVTAKSPRRPQYVLIKCSTTFGIIYFGFQSFFLFSL